MLLPLHFWLHSAVRCMFYKSVHNITWISACCFVRSSMLFDLWNAYENRLPASFLQAKILEVGDILFSLQVYFCIDVYSVTINIPIFILHLPDCEFCIGSSGLSAIFAFFCFLLQTHLLSLLLHALTELPCMIHIRSGLFSI